MDKKKLLESLKGLSSEVADLEVKIGEIIKEVEESKEEESKDSPSSIPIHLQMEQESILRKIWKSPVISTWCLIILLVIGMSFFFYHFSNFNKEGLACQHQPFKWGAEKVVKHQVTGLYCSCETAEFDKFANSYNNYQPYKGEIVNLEIPEI